MALLAQSTASADQPLELFGTKLLGFTPDNARKLLITVGLILGAILINWVLLRLARLFLKAHRTAQVVFWVKQGISLLLWLITVIGILSIWFDNPTRLATFAGLVTAGIAFALQKPISAMAGYLVILRGKTFTIGDRITMGGVRGDVISLRFTQTTIMEMGQPPAVQNDDPAMWVHARQYTGRIVTISNANIFDEPVYNYTREFPYIWEEMRLPISYRDDRKKAEQILLEAANRHTVKARDLGKEELAELTRRYFLPEQDVMPRVYYRLTDNWIELTVRFLAHAHGVRDLKDAMSREIIGAFDDAGIQIASSTYDVVGMPAIRVQLDADGSQTKHTAKNSKRQQRDVSHQTSHGDSSDSP